MYRIEDMIWRGLGIIERYGVGGDRLHPFSLNSNNNQSLNPYSLTQSLIRNDLTISSWYLDSYNKCMRVYEGEDKIWRELGIIERWCRDYEDYKILRDKISRDKRTKLFYFKLKQ